MNDLGKPPNPKERPPQMPRITPCPKCGDHNSRPCHAVFAEGTSTITTQTRGGGVAFGPGGRMMPMIGSASTSGTRTTALAAMCAPPARYPHPAKAILAGVIFSVIALVVLPFVAATILALGGSSMREALGSSGESAQAFDQWFLNLFTLAGILALMSWSVRCAIRNHGFNTQQWPPLHAVWQRLWVCMRCHTQFDPDPGGAGQAAAAVLSSTPAKNPMKLGTIFAFAVIGGFALFLAFAVLDNKRSRASAAPSSPQATPPVASNNQGVTLSVDQIGALKAEDLAKYIRDNLMAGQPAADQETFAKFVYPDVTDRKYPSAVSLLVGSGLIDRSQGTCRDALVILFKKCGGKGWTFK